MPNFARFQWRGAGLLALGFCIMAAGSCSRHADSASYLKLAEAEARYGRLITAGNHPTEERNGTGVRIGLFLDVGGEVWGLPLDLGSDGAVLACAPANLRDAKVTDTLPAGTSVIGATNEPTGEYGGTGNLELLLRNADGTVRWQTVRGSHLEGGPVCHAPRPPGPALELQYYRLALAGGGPEKPLQAGGLPRAQKGD